MVKRRQHMLINRHFRDLNPLTVGREDCVPGKKHGPAIRKYTLIHYVESGEGIITNEHGTYRVHAGEAFIILPGEITTYAADEENPWSYSWVGFDGEKSEDFKKLDTVIAFPGDIISRMLETAGQNLREYRMASLLFELYAELFEEEEERNLYVRRVKDHIRTLYMQPLSVEEIADMMKLDRRYLSRLFKQNTGRTIQQYLIYVRMEEAKKYLSKGVSVERTAMLCGYFDTCNFSKMFKRYSGVSPMKWKTMGDDTSLMQNKKL